MTKLLLLFGLMLSFIGCDTADLSTYEIKYNQTTDVITINGVDYDNMGENGNILNQIALRLNIEENSILIATNEEIFSLKLKGDVKYRLQYLNRNAYKIVLIDEELSNLNNFEITLVTNL